MGFTTRVLCIAFSIFALSSVLFAVEKTAPEADKGKVTLTYDSGKTVTCLTPHWVSGGARVEVKSAMTKVKIAGKSIPAAGWKGERGNRIGLDANGDGIVDNTEYRNVASGGFVLLTGKIDDMEMVVRCTNVAIAYDKNKGNVTHMRWRMQGLYGWIGKINSVKIRILDENLDGKYSSNGSDAIQIGTSKLALPFREQHRIGDKFYKLKISPDGSSLEYTKISDPKVGLVNSPFKGKYLLGLVLDSGHGAFELNACKRTGMPAGTYTVVYGAVGTPRAPTMLYRDRGAIKYAIQADKKNLLRIGLPLQLVFSSRYEENRNKDTKQVVRKLIISPPNRIVGVGGELYGPVIFPNARSPKGRPVVMILQGGRTLVKASMPERNGNLANYEWVLPRKVSPNGIKVVVVASVHGFRKVMGARTIKQIVAREVIGPPKTDKPSVSVKPWKKPNTPTVVKKKPTPRVVKPKPTTRPVKPPKSVSTDDQKAQRLLKLAESYDTMKLRDKSIATLKKVLEKYPDTKAAITAKILLDSMQ
ncbi:MAG: hypothetical protein GY794_14965 [bacterium]|nr:hypothetical protein [bacterium]